MAGSIRQRGKQSWEIRAFAGKPRETGKKRDVTRTAGERRDAEVALGRLVGEIEDGHHGVHTGRVGDVCKRWYSQATPDLSPTVAPVYRHLPDRGILSRLGDVPPRRRRDRRPRPVVHRATPFGRRAVPLTAQRRDHVKTVFDKLGVSSRSELVARLDEEHDSHRFHKTTVHVG